MIDKAPDAYRTISEVAEDLDLPQHVLRFWETRFSQIRPLKRGGGRRYYRPDDVELLKGIRYLLYSEGYTIKGVQRILKEQGPKAVQTLVQGPAGAAMAAAPTLQHPEPDEARVAALDDDADDPLAPFEVHADVADDLAFPPAGPAHTPGPVFVAPPPSAPPAPTDLFALTEPAPPPRETPPARANVSFMRGGLKPIVIAGQESAPPPLLRRAIADEEVAEAPSPRPAPHVEMAASRSVAPPPAEPPRRPGVLTEEQRRALQSALFELSECRRAIETLNVGRDR